MKALYVAALLAALCTWPVPPSQAGPVAEEPPAPEEQAALQPKFDGQSFVSLEELLENLPPATSADAEYPPDASEAHAMELCEKNPTEENALTLGILRAGIALRSLEAYRAKNPRPAPDEDADLRKALAYALRAAEQVPDRADFYYLLARVFGAFGCHGLTRELAMEACDEALDCDPDHAEALYFLAGLEFQSQYFDDAVTDFLKAFALSPELFDLNAMPLFGSACLLSERAIDGMAFAQDRLGTDPNDGAALFALAQFQRALDRKEAVETLRKAAAALAGNAPAADYAHKVAALWEAEK